MTVYAVDIDGTLCEESEEWWNYAEAIPIKENIKTINRVYHEKNSTLILYTARFEEDKQVTQQWLNKFGVKYHRLIMDKVRADVYVDSAMVKPEDL